MANIPTIIGGIFLVFLLSLSFLKSPLKDGVPDEMGEKAKELKKTSETKLELAENTYDFVNKKFTSPIREYLRQPNRVLLKDREEIWNIENGYIPSNTQNQVYKELLILTEEFKEDDFKFIQSKCNTFPTNTPHEYWELNIDGQVVFIDLWGADHTNLSNEGFGCFASPPCELADFVCAEGFP